MPLYLQPRILAVLCLGIASGLPLALTGATLKVWLTESHIELTTIGLFGMVALPYTLKFLWAPLVDTLPLPWLTDWLGKRRSWLLVSQLAVAGAMALLAFSTPGITPAYTALCALLLATASATQDIVIDAYRIEMLEPPEQGAGSAMTVLGYRLGMLLSGAGALAISEVLSWSVVILSLIPFLFLASLVAWVMGEPVPDNRNPEIQMTEEDSGIISSHLHHAIIAPFRDIMQRPGWIPVLLFIVSYKLCDAYAGEMSMPFYLWLGFSKMEIAGVIKLFGMLATIGGGLLGGWLVLRFGLMRSLWLGAVLQMLSNLVYLLQYWAGPDIRMLWITISVENLSGGIGTSAFVAFISVYCNKSFTATQYALLTALASLGRTVFASSSGLAAEHLGWLEFYMFSALLALPAFYFLQMVKKYGRVEG